MKQKKINISLWIKPEILDKLAKLAKKADIKRSQLIINLIDVGYDGIKTQKNIGIIKLTLALKKYTSKISKLLQGAEKKIILNEEDQRGKNVSVRIDPEMMDKIDALAQKIEMSRSTFIEYVLENSIRNINILTFIGVTDSVIIIEKLRKEVKNIWIGLIKKSEKALKDKKVVSTLNEDIDENKK